MHVRRISLLFAAALVSGTAVTQVPWAGYWMLNETSGKVAHDISPFRNDGVLKNFSGNPWVKGKIGNALSFDGVDDYVDIQIKKGLPIYRGKGVAYSITFWVKAPAQRDKRVYSEGSSKSDKPLFTLGSGYTNYNQGDKLRVYIRNDKGYPNVFQKVTNSVVFDDKWHHVAWVDVSGKAVVYVDGVKDKANFDYTKSSVGTWNSRHGTYTMDRVSLGAVLRAKPVAFLKGLIDDVRVYRFALSAADVQVVMKGGQPKYRGSLGRFGPGCGTGPLVLSGTGEARIGKTLFLQLVLGTANSAGFLFLGSDMKPMDLTSFGFKGCTLYTLPVGMLGMGLLNAAGSSKVLNLPIPNDAALVGNVFYLQGVTLWSTPSLGLATSNALVLQPGL